MAKIGSQKLYNTARAGQGALLQFMLSCPDNLSPWNQNKLQAAIMQAQDPTAVMLCLARLPAGESIGQWAQQTVEQRTWLGYEHGMDQRVMRERLDAGIALFQGEFATATLSSYGCPVAFAVALRDWAALDTVIGFLTRNDGYHESREDDVCNVVYSNFGGGGGYGVKREPKLFRTAVQHALQFGTRFGLTGIYRGMDTKLVSWGMDDLAAYLYDTRPEADLLDATQRKVLNAMSLAARERVLNRDAAEPNQGDRDED
jgi:hypothetical protein